MLTILWYIVFHPVVLLIKKCLVLWNKPVYLCNFESNLFKIYLLDLQYEWSNSGQLYYSNILTIYKQVVFFWYGNQWCISSACIIPSVIQCSVKSSYRIRYNYSLRCCYVNTIKSLSFQLSTINVDSGSRNCQIRSVQL